MECGHEIGLHFDEKNYPDLFGNPGEELKEKIKKETEILSILLEKPVNKVSYHRPSKEILEADLNIPGIVNSYNNIFFRQCKYISDSRCNWREPVMDIISQEKYHHLHILTHAFWYHEEEKDVKKILTQFVRNAREERYVSLSENMRDVNEFLRREEI